MTVSEDISFSLLPSSGYRKLMVFRKIIFSKSQFVYYFQRLTRAKYISTFLLKILNIKYKYCKQNNLSSMSNRNSLSLPASSYIIKKQFICRFKLFSNNYSFILQFEIIDNTNILQNLKNVDLSLTYSLQIR